MTGPLKNALAPKKVVRATGVEPITFGFGDRRSIQLSYARTKSHFRQTKPGQHL